MDHTKSMKTGSIVTRRSALKLGAAGLAMPALLHSPVARAANKTWRIGLVSPQTGPLASFGEGDDYVIPAVNKALAGGITTDGETYGVEILVKDCQSSSSRAAEVASELVLRDEVDILVCAGGPDTVNPTADQAEALETPCLSTADPWQAYFFGRNGDPATGFDWTYHFCFGLEDIVQAFLGLWDTADTNKVVGGLFPNDADGNAWSEGFTPAMKQAGYTLINPGAYQNFSDDFSSQISAFKEANVEIVTGAMLPPDFITFWTQAAQQDFRPKVVTIGKALGSPSVVKSLGARGIGLSSEIPWSSAYPYVSGLTGETAGDLMSGYVQATGREPNFVIGLQHAVFEVAADVLRRAKVKDPQAVVDAIKATNYQSIAGRVDWSTGPVKNVCKTPLVAGQWDLVGEELSLLIAENAGHPDIPLQTELKLLG